MVGGSRDGRGEGMVGVKRMKAVYRVRGGMTGVKKFYKMMSGKSYLKKTAIYVIHKSVL